MTPTGESTAGMLQSSGYTMSGDPRSGGHSAHSSPLRPGMGLGLESDLAAVQNSLANMGLQVRGG